MKDEEPGVSFLSLLRMFRLAKKIRPVVVESTCGHCKIKYDVTRGHMCPYVKELYSNLGES